MKTLKLDHTLAQLVLRGEKTSTWRIFDEKDLSVNDKIQFIDKVDPSRHDSWRAIGTAKIQKVVQKRLGDVTESDMAGHEHFASRQDLLSTYRGYYGPEVSWETPVKIIYFSFMPYEATDPSRIVTAHVDYVNAYADGGSRGNPGPSASGFVLYDEAGNLLVRRGNYIGVTTNNQAEYTALKLALEEAKQLQAKEVGVFMDSMLVVNHMKGVFKVRNRDLWPIHVAVKELCRSFRNVKFTQIPRELNKQADATVNEVLDKHQSNVKPLSQG